MFSLSIIALLNSDAVKPAGANQLNISDDQAPLLLKNSLSLAVDQNSLYYPTYKPYSIFGEQLSHISEEDANQLDRMLTAEDSLRHVSSYDSNAPSFYSRRTAANEELHRYYSRYTEEQVMDENQEPSTVHVYALALLPLPSVTDPLIALLSKQDDEETDEELFPRNYYYYNHQQQQNNPQLMKLKNWKMTTLDITLLLLGITKAMLNTFLFIYVYSILDFSIMDISFLIIAHIASEMVVHFIIEKWYIHKLNLTLITTLTHISLILCCIIYPNLKAGHRITFTTLIVLQVLQAGAFQLIWSAGVDQIHVVIWNQYERMKERARVSFLFSSLGPAIGALMAGIILQPELEEYSFLFKISVAILALSFVVSWGWTAED
ncbi:hypothetical protein G6F37_000867 [Rhizopus arrhizus]|nr:hypothetical protein G6F38_009152 [Rhizopus arrhizus]KAG1163798.1 hypothetical protein G6F37_000867 [Rhizopus arrhizus]